MEADGPNLTAYRIYPFHETYVACESDKADGYDEP